MPRRMILPNPTTQRFEMDDEGGVEITKWGHSIFRNVDNDVFHDGERVD